MTKWYSDQGLTYPQVLSQLESSKLLQELGIGDFMSDDQCQRSSTHYSPSMEGWKKTGLCIVSILLTYTGRLNFTEHDNICTVEPV